jgi:hypothetical protein
MLSCDEIPPPGHKGHQVNFINATAELILLGVLGALVVNDAISG